MPIRFSDADVAGNESLQEMALTLISEYQYGTKFPFLDTMKDRYVSGRHLSIAQRRGILNSLHPDAIPEWTKKKNSVPQDGAKFPNHTEAKFKPGFIYITLPSSYVVHRILEGKFIWYGEGPSLWVRPLCRTKPFQEPTIIKAYQGIMKEVNGEWDYLRPCGHCAKKYQGDF